MNRDISSCPSISLSGSIRAPCAGAFHLSAFLGFTYRAVSTSIAGQTVQLDAVFDLAKPNQADTVYDVISIDRGRARFARGADLMSKGVQLVASPISDAHVLVFRPTSR